MKKIFNSHVLVAVIASVLTSTAATAVVSELYLAKRFVVTDSDHRTARGAMSVDNKGNAFLYLDKVKGGNAHLNGEALVFTNSKEEVVFLVGLSEEEEPLMAYRRKDGSLSGNLLTP